MKTPEERVKESIIEMKKIRKKRSEEDLGAIL